mmetsp:Transcript_66924/g.160264  ORF Transcript_66924/g.160264 Transcript_66924/m.160264 type:complete len:260 (-) Transcript_66924:144-923(-)
MRCCWWCSFGGWANGGLIYDLQRYTQVYCQSACLVLHLLPVEGKVLHERYLTSAFQHHEDLPLSNPDSWGVVHPHSLNLGDGDLVLKLTIRNYGKVAFLCVELCKARALVVGKQPPLQGSGKQNANEAVEAAEHVVRVACNIVPAQEPKVLGREGGPLHEILAEEGGDSHNAKANASNWLHNGPEDGTVRAITLVVFDHLVWAVHPPQLWLEIVLKDLDGVPVVASTGELWRGCSLHSLWSRCHGCSTRWRGHKKLLGQ